jgi:anti-sigma factor RsiW
MNNKTIRGCLLGLLSVGMLVPMAHASAGSPVTASSAATSTLAKAAPVSSIPRTSDLHGLLISAIDTPAVEKKAWLDGPIADKLRVQTKAPASTPVLARISTLNVIRPGCSRMRRQLGEPSHKMETVKGTKEPFNVYFDLNICRDGRPPQDSKVGLGK